MHLSLEVSTNLYHHGHSKPDLLPLLLLQHWTGHILGLPPTGLCDDGCSCTGGRTDRGAVLLSPEGSTGDCSGVTATTLAPLGE